ncbi:MAG: hypothetical protein KDC44_14820, partial [Phaeodactylibacter sp.]|nr:hypothetical protein [Phaeodactylibacter sp.]
MENYPSSAIPEIVYFIEYGDGQVERFKGTTLSHTFSHEYEYEISGGFQVVAHATSIYSVLDEPDSQSAQVDPNVSGVTPPTNLSFFESGETVPTGSNGVAKIDLEWTGARQGDVVRANVKFMRNSSGVQTNAIVFFKVPKGTITFEDAVEVPDVVHDKIQFGDSAGDIDALVVESTTNYLYFQKLLRFDNSTNKEGVFFTDIVVDANLSDGNFPIEVGYVGPGNTTDFWSSSLSSTTSNLDGLDTDQTLSLMVNSARDPNNFSVDPAYLLVNLNPGADDLTDPANFELLEDPNDFDFNLFIQNESLESVVGAILVGIDPDSRLEAAAASIIPDFVHLGLPHFDYEIHKLEDIRLTRAINILESSSFTTVDYDRFEENLWLIQPERSRTDNGVLGGNDLGAFSFSMNNVSLSGLIPGDEISSGAMVVFIGQLPVGSNSVFERLGDPSDNSSLLTITDVTETNAAITRVICANCSPDPPNPSGTSPCNCCPSEVRADSGSSIIILNNSNGNTIEVNIGDDDEDDDEAAGSSNDGGAIRGFKVGTYLPNNRQDGPQIESGKLAGLVYRKRLS